MASSADVIVLDDSSSDEENHAVFSTVASRTTRPVLNDLPKSTGNSSSSKRPTAAKSTQTEKVGQRKKAFLSSIGYSSGSDDDDSDREELDVAPPKSKKALPLRYDDNSTRRPRLSSTGSTKFDPVDLLADSPPTRKNEDYRDNGTQGREKTSKQPTKNTPTKRKAVPTVSLSIDSSSSSSGTEFTSDRNKENSKNSSERVVRRKFGGKVETDETKTQTSSRSHHASASRPQHSSLSEPDNLRQLLESSSDDDTLLLDRKPAARKKALMRQINVARSNPPSSPRPQSSTRNNNPLTFSPTSSSSDDEDESVYGLSSLKSDVCRQHETSKSSSKTSTTTAKNRREEEKAERQRQKELAKAAKQREKEQAKEKRDRERLERKQAQETEKQQKKRAREVSDQARGKFAHQEVAVLMEPLLLNHATFGIKEVFEEKAYKAYPYPSGLNCMAVQWIRRDYLKGGSNEAMERAHNFQIDEFEQMNILTVVFDSPHDFICLVESEEDSPRNAYEEDDDYPKLEEWLLGLVAGWRAAWKKTSADRPRIFLILYQVQEALNRAWINYNRSRGGRARGPPPPNNEQLQDAILWMLIQFQIEVIHCESKDDVAKELAKMSRFIAESRYQKQTTEINCIQKLKAQVSDMAPSYERAVDCWMRQVQQVPRVSGEMARVFVRFYPTARSLWLAYRDPELSEDEKQVLLADCFGTRSSQVKISKMIYRIMHSQSPDELLT